MTLEARSACHPDGRIALSECLDEVTEGVGSQWSSFRVVGATRSGIARAKESVGQHPDRYKLVQPGTIFYNPMRILLGSIALLDDGEAPGITSPDYVVFRTRSGLLHHRWFYYWLRSAEGAAFIRALTRGAVRERMLFRRLAAARIVAPSWNRQLAFAREILVVEGARAAAAVQREAAKAIPTACLRAAFANMTPLSVVGRRRAVPPDSWSWQVLTSLARLESGHTPSRYHPEWWGGDIPWISLADIRDLDGKIAYETRERTNKDGIANSAARVLPKGTVVLSRTASVGFVSLMGREMATSQDFVCWVCGPSLDERFLAYLLRASRRYLLTLSSGAIHQTIYMPTVEAFEVCVPDLPQQRRIAGLLDEQMAQAERARRTVEEELGAINALPAALLRRAVNRDL